MLYDFRNGQTSVVLRFKLRNSSVTTGAGLTGLTSASSGLIISTIADNEASATAYTVAGSLVETIATLGTYAAPTATKCRFKEVDATNHPGIYEFQFADARFAVSSAKSLTISVSGATNLAQCDVIVPLRVINPYAGDFALSGVIAASVSGNVSGNVTGSVGSVAGSVSGNVTGSVGSVAGNVTGNVSGNVTGSVGSVLGITFPTNFGVMSIDSNGAVKIQGSIKKNTALAGFPFYMALASDHVSPATGKTITVTRAIDGGAFASCANAAAEIGSGWYQINLAASDLNGNTVALSFAASLCDTTILTVATQP